jgi:hypothetical protein
MAIILISQPQPCIHTCTMLRVHAPQSVCVHTMSFPLMACALDIYVTRKMTGPAIVTTLFTTTNTTTTTTTTDEGNYFSFLLLLHDQQQQQHKHKHRQQHRSQLSPSLCAR